MRSLYRRQLSPRLWLLPTLTDAIINVSFPSAYYELITVTAVFQGSVTTRGFAPVAPAVSLHLRCDKRCCIHAWLRAVYRLAEKVMIPDKETRVKQKKSRREREREEWKEKGGGGRAAAAAAAQRMAMHLQFCGRSCVRIVLAANVDGRM